ncbi:LysR substrate-binding domain-containing protein [Pseudomonas guariconensis]|uniref:LysR family transcriptional regulator n=1 Tax=Pseudomonas guariconensis TaxID=1288410 RepID=UPI002363C6E0|nr:LysR family transcriptional regulator [Pseudomonas guariconensis]MDD2089813.1 LysR substrate-binding domain-containing protein [Pseudomonas guariconensis]
METLANLESFVRSAECGSFSAAARRLGLTPAAISRNVAQLETNLGVRLFQRSTRRLTLTEAGERFLGNVGGGLESIQAAITDLTSSAGAPAGLLRVSAAPAFGRDHLLPLMPDFLARYPAVTPEWHFDNRQVELITEGFDAAIGGGIELSAGVVARELAPAHLILVASPEYLAGRSSPRRPEQLAAFDHLGMRSVQSGKVRSWMLQNSKGERIPLELRPRMLVNDPQALCQSTLLGLGLALLAVPDVLTHLQSGALRRVLPDWYVDAGPISLYFASQKLLPAKTRAFVDLLVEHSRDWQWGKRFDARFAAMS